MVIHRLMRQLDLPLKISKYQNLIIGIISQFFLIFGRIPIINISYHSQGLFENELVKLL